MGNKLKAALALAIGVGLIILESSSGQAAPSFSNTGAIIYWLSYAFGVPAIAASIVWVIRRKHENRASAAASAFLWLTALIAVAGVLRLALA